MLSARVLVVAGLSAAALSAYAARRPHPRPLGPARFTESTLVHAVDVSPDTKLLTIALPSHLIPCDHRVFAPIWSIFIKDSDIQVERPYTPLEGIDNNGHIRLWVKKYERGEVGRWLHARQVGDPIEIRGPVTTWSPLWQGGQPDHVISGGTGITPFYQLIQSVFRTRDTFLNTRFTLLHASKSLADLPPPDITQSLTSFSQDYPDRFKFHLFAESLDGTSHSHSPNIYCGRIGKSAIQEALQPTHDTPWWRKLFASSPPPFSPDRRTLVLVCGPEGMVSTIAGPYGRNYSQGQVGGILAQLGLKSQHVWKL